MKKLLVLLAIASLPVMASADKKCEKCAILRTDSVNLSRMAEFNGTVEKHISRDAYQFIDASGRVLAEVDGDVWRATNITDKNGILTIS